MASRNPNELQFSSICRVCAEPSSILNNLFSQREKSILLVEMVSQCVRIEISQNDGRPTSICNKCINNLIIAYDFQCLAQASEEKFQKLLFDSATDFDTGIFFCENTVSVDIKEKMEELCNDKVRDIQEKKFADDQNIEFETNVEVKLKRLSSEYIEKMGKTKPKSKRNIKKINRSAKRAKRESLSISYECYRCKTKQFNKKGKLKCLQSHLKVHREATSHECEICGMFYSKKNIEHHLCKGKTIRCEYCTCSFESTLKLLEHLDVHKNFKLYKCIECKKMLQQKDLLDWHMNKHSAIMKTFVCDANDCNRSFHNIYRLREHQRAHSDKKAHLCSECGLTLKSKASLNAHLIVHTEKSISCPHCPKTFYRIHNMKKHMEIHLDIKYTCVICDRVLSSKRSLEEHTRNVHRKDYKYKCDLCFKKFPKPSSLKQHMYTHTGERPFQCQYCPRAYSQNADLNKHLRIHVGQNTYACNICPMTFRLQIDLRKHSFEHFQNQTNGRNNEETNN